MIECEVKTSAIGGTFMVDGTKHGLTPGKRYRVTVVQADAPKPEPIGWMDAKAAKRARVTMVNVFHQLPQTHDDVPLYEHPPAPSKSPADETLAERWVPTSRFL